MQNVKSDSKKSILFIDSKVEGYEKLIAGVNPDTEVVILNAHEDGIQQISDNLRLYHDLENIHIVSHGANAEIHAGSSTLSPTTWHQYHETLASWKAAFSKTSQVFLYGCEIAKEAVGQSFVKKIAQTIQASVAASIDLTGAQSKGGNWDLAFQYGSITQTKIFNQNALDSFDSVLPAPTITSATYDASTGALVVTATDLLPTGGETNDIDVTKLTFTGQGSTGRAYTLTSATGNVEITSATSFTVTLGVADKMQVDALLNKNGTSAADTTTFNLAAAAAWNVADAGGDDATGNAITVSNLVPSISGASYDATTGVLDVMGSGLVATTGATNDIAVTKLTVTGQGGATYTLTTSPNVEIDSTDSTKFSITLSDIDKLNINGLLNKDGASADDNTTFNLSAAAGWNVAEATIVDTTNGIMVSNVVAPAITSATYNASSGDLVVTGTNFVKLNGAINDIDATKFTFTGDGATTRTLSDSANVEITSATSFTIALGTADKAAINAIVNKNGTASTSSTTYNLAAAEDWAKGAAASNNIVDTTIAVTASNIAVPTITSATYDVSSGSLVVTGTGFLKLNGATNDIDATKFTFKGNGAGTRALSDSANVEITSATAFTIALGTADKAAVNALINSNGTASTDTTTYNLAAAEDWAKGAAAGVADVDATNGITVSGYTAPSSSSGSSSTTTTTNTTTTTDNGATVTQTTTKASDGTVTTTISATSPTSTGGANTIEVALSKDDKGTALVSADLPVGVGLEVLGKNEAFTAAKANTELTSALTNVFGKSDPALEQIKNQFETFVSELPADNNTFTIQTITPTLKSNQTPNTPIALTGSTSADSQQALIIDASELPAGTIFTLDNVEFATFSGSVKVYGGAGENYVVGDKQPQTFVLGADNDTLWGGGGDDHIGSLNGDDNVSGDDGNDFVFGGIGNDTLGGGAGNDQLNGGFGFDHATQSGEFKDYTVAMNGHTVVLKDANGQTDSFTDVELINFANGPSLAIAYSEIEAAAHHLAKTWLGRDLTAAEGDFVQNLSGATINDLLAAYRTLPEAASTSGKSNDELLADLKNNLNIVRIDLVRNLVATDGNDEGYLSLGAGLDVDGGKGIDILRMTGNREDSHLEFNGDKLELTQLNDGAMLKLANAEMIAYDDGESVVFAHNSLEAVVARLVHSFFDRDVTVDEWQLALEVINHQASLENILTWFKDNTADLQDLSNTDYINAIHQNTLGRAASTEELSADLARLDANSVTRESYAAEIAESSEAATHLIGSVMLHEGWV